MDDNQNDPLADADAPFWRRPLPLIQRPAEDADPLADAPAPETLQNFDAPHSNGTAPLPNPPAKATPRPVSVADAQRALVASQLRNVKATDAQREARGKVALALEKFQRATMQTQTQEQLIRQHIASENEQRRLRAEGKIAPRGGQRRLGSAIDSYAFHTRNSGRGAGGGRAFSRGASSKSSLKAFPGSGLPPVRE
jgi:hypothetical protein